MTTTSINTADAKEEFTELVNRVAIHKERIILTRRDKEIAAIVPLEDLKYLEESRNKNDLAEATEALKEARAQGTFSLDELKTEIG
jgi:prevent-host-death family protein